MANSKHLYDLENEYEIALISEVLTDLGIPFWIRRLDYLVPSSVIGHVPGWFAGPNMVFYAELWAAEEDAEHIGELLAQVRDTATTYLEDTPSQGRPHMWRIKKS